MSSANSPYCEHTDIHNLINAYGLSMDTYKNLGLGIMHFAPAYKNPFLLHPVANVIGLLNESLKGKVLKTNVDDNNELYAITCENKNILNVIILNFKQDRQISLNFEQFKNKLNYLGNKSLGKDVPEFLALLMMEIPSSNP